VRRVVVVGAGPAGMAAAVCAAEGGRQVTLIDDNPEPGGQIWRGETEGAWFERLQRVRVARLPSARVVTGDPDARALTVELPDRTVTVTWDDLILATGARERFLPFPGWTLPGVLGAGGIQALVKSGLDVRGKRVLVAGTGPLLLAVAALLRSRGANVLGVAEQASGASLRKFAFSLPWRKLWQGFELRRGIRYWTSCWVESAEGRDRVERVRLHGRGVVECDYVAVGYGLVPNTELAQILRGAGTLVGECNGVGGVEKSLIEGQIAGHAAAGNAAGAARLQPELDRARKFAASLDKAFALRPELRHLAQAETLVCRCESVTHGDLKEFGSWREAKLYGRCGMGPCQGRVCGPAAEFLYGWQPSSVRPPVLPARVGSLLGEQHE